MDFIEFSIEDKVGVKIIDEQHNEIAAIINSMHTGILAADKKVILNFLRKLLEVLEIHFETEERLMKQTNFPGYFSHKLEHDRFYNQILASTNNFSEDKEVIGLKQLKGIKLWFFNHIEHNDRKSGEHIAGHGIS